MTKLKVLLSGSTGFIGSALYDQLDHQFEFILLPRSLELASSEKADVFFHTAGITAGRKGAASKDPAINLEITSRALETAAAAGVKRFVHAGSYIYGIPQYLPIDEDHPLSSLSPYMGSKLQSEELIKSFAEKNNISAVSLRIFNVYGPGQKPGTVISDLLAQINNSEITLGDPTPERDYVHVKDVVSAFALAATAQIRGFEAINIGSGTSISVEDLAKIVLKYKNSHAQLIFKPEQRANQIPEVRAAIGKAKRLLGWSPRITLEEGLRTLSS